ncbi:YidH family protein [Chlorogloeopsis sp. ULAP02]|uniref:YidH family protein n=1 Tax=Chlorogloeopsis sp. ULAP02 TaxID=3107926 RepID=UPI003135FDC0
MNTSPPPKPSNTTTELAKQRNRAAAERTLTSWIQNCLSLIAFGIAFDRIFVALNQTFPKQNLQINTQLTHIIGLSAIAFGVFLLVLAILGYLINVKSLDKEDYLYRKYSSFYPLKILIGSVIVFGLLAFFAVYFVISMT